MNTKKIASELESLFDKLTAYKEFTPIENGFVYKNYKIVRNEFMNWNIIYKQKIIATMFLKLTCFEFCKAHECRKLKFAEEIKDIDNMFKINYNDSIFLKYALDKSTDDKKGILLSRYSIVEDKLLFYRTKITKLFKLTLYK